MTPRLTPPEPSTDDRDVERPPDPPAEVIEAELEERERAEDVAGDLDSLEYDELQRLALLYGIRANQSPDALAAAIREVIGR